MADSRSPTGLARRGRRLSDEQTEERMLSAARRMLTGTGLTVSLDHISFEDIIRAADVSRSTVYRRWPHKDLFFSDLVKDLARNAVPTILTDELTMIRQIVADRADWLNTPAKRHSLIAELFRQLALLDFQTLRDSAEWRTYVALHATYLSLADDELRSQVQAALAQSEQEHAERVAAAWKLLTGLLGYRLRPETGATFHDLAVLVDATMRGWRSWPCPCPSMPSTGPGPGRSGPRARPNGPCRLSASPASPRRSSNPILTSSGTRNGSRPSKTR